MNISRIRREVIVEQLEVDTTALALFETAGLELPERLKAGSAGGDA